MRAQRAVLFSLVLGLAPLGYGSVVVNGGFETGDLTGWTTTGNVTVQDFASSGGAGGTPPAGGSFHSAGSDGTGAVAQATVESFLGLAAGTLDTINGGGAAASTFGSAMKQTITVVSGTALSFDWDFGTFDTRIQSRRDFGFYTVDGTAYKLADTSDSTTLLSNPVLALYHTGYQTQIHFLEPGTYTIGFGVMDALDNIQNSILLVDNVATDVFVPEPTVVSLGVAFAGMMGLARPRRKA